MPTIAAIAATGVWFSVVVPGGGNGGGMGSPGTASFSLRVTMPDVQAAASAVEAWCVWRDSAGTAARVAVGGVPQASLAVAMDANFVEGGGGGASQSGSSDASSGTQLGVVALVAGAALVVLIAAVVGLTICTPSLCTRRRRVDVGACAGGDRRDSGGSQHVRVTKPGAVAAPVTVV